MKELEEIGYWWIPSNPEILVPGLLKFSSSTGIKLEVIGSFQENRTLEPLILGTTQGKFITLCKNRVIQSSLSAPGFSRKKYTVDTAFIGVHFSSFDEIKFHRVAVEYSYLADWADLPAIKREEEFEKDTDNLQGFNFSYTCPEIIRGNTDLGALSLVYTYQDSGEPFKINFYQSANFEIESPEEFSLSDWLAKFIFPLQNFITLGTDRPNSLTRVLVFSRYGERAIKDPLHFTRQDIPIEVIYRGIYTEPRQNNFLLPDDFLFKLEDIKETFGDTMTSWLAIATELDSVCNLFFSTKYNQKLYQENRFLNIVQAAESYHRRRRVNQILTKEEHKKRISRIIDNALEEDKEWLKTKLSFSYAPSLKERLVDLAQEAREIISPLITDQELFVTQVRNSRHYFTHYDKSLKEKAVKGEDLYWLTYTLEILLQTCLLKELGFSSEQCITLFRKNKRYQFAIEKTKSIEPRS